jgi:hypothetical protein
VTINNKWKINIKEMEFTMNALKYEMSELEEQPDEADIENLQPEMELPEVHWAKDIARIENPILREREIEDANKIVEKEEKINARIASGELCQFDAEMEFESLRQQKAAASTRSGLASVGLTYDHFIDVADEYDRLTPGDYRTVELADQVKRKVCELGPQEAQELADLMLEEGRLSRKTYDFISRQARLLSLK